MNMPKESNIPSLDARARIRRFLQWVRLDRIRAGRYAKDEIPVPSAPRDTPASEQGSIR
jgi:hypothetical protein